MSNRVTARQATNVKILRKLEAYIRKYPNQRFGQILRNSGAVLDVYNSPGERPIWVNEFSVEPDIILQRMEDYDKGK